ncbi:MAG: DNA-binding response regulator [Betaproteobacteria bacterium HGW-Betaproteobacteria-20]|jgi:FixJ family two-component response regulator|nr:MAG: DNA-binding response regulator [Betaproteobacteria bacterium HGW-Betaproteobacteria-20]
MSTTKSTVFIVDDDAAIRDSLSLMIEQENIAVQSFESAEAFLDAYRPECRGCAIIDIRMQGMNGMELHEVLLKNNITLPVIFLTGHGDIPMSVRAIKAGAVDFLTKPVTREKLLTSIRSAIQKSEIISSENVIHQEALSRLADLTDRERDVMLLAVQGYLNKQIARELGISHRTVEIHKSKIMHKTGAVNLLDLARIVHESDLIN